MNELRRLQTLGPAEADVDGSHAANEAIRMLRLALEASVADLDGSFAVNEARRLAALRGTGVGAAGADVSEPAGLIPILRGMRTPR